MLDLLERLKVEAKKLPSVASLILIQKFSRDPFKILIFCLLSLRTKDPVALSAAFRLFAVAPDPCAISMADYMLIEKLIFPVGFYRKKARIIENVSRIIADQYDSVVPRSYDELIALPGVGPKTANLVLAEGFLIPAICVDTHVHRLSNRLGLVKTKSPEQTRVELENLIHQDQWILINRALVAWGQNICKPVSPLCSVCPLRDICPRVSVAKSR